MFFVFSLKNVLVPWTSHVKSSHIWTKFLPVPDNWPYRFWRTLLLIEELKQKLQVYIYKCPRSNLWIWWCRRIQNKELQRQAGQKLIEQEIKERTRKWIGLHKLRSLDGNMTTTALKWNSQWKLKTSRDPTHLKAHGMMKLRREVLHGMRQKSLLSQSISGEPTFH